MAGIRTEDDDDDSCSIGTDSHGPAFF